MARQSPHDLSKEEFQRLGHRLIDDVAGLIDGIRSRGITSGKAPGEIKAMLGQGELPAMGQEIEQIFSRTTDLLLRHSLFNGHPKFMGYITGSPAPAGMLADLLASAINPNVGAQILSPVATEIERQTVRWLSEFIGFDPNTGGLLVSGGNMANFTAFLAARTAKAPKSVKEDGIASAGKLVLYCSKTTHTWIEKAAVLFGLGSKAIRWIPVGEGNQMNNQLLEQALKEDLRHGLKPFMIVGTAGDVSTGAVDDLEGIGELCREFDLWFHIDGAYGIPAAAVPELKARFAGLEEADSIALDPHKWLYAPLEAGCTLVKNPKHLTDTFSSHPEYYNFDAGQQGAAHNFYEYGPQNSRGFRALKVWMLLQHVGSKAYVDSIREDVDLSKLMFDLAKANPELEAVTQSLSITTLRYVPGKVPNGVDREKYLNQINEKLLNKLQSEGEVFLSNAVVNGKYCLRACIVNFRTTERDVKEIIECIVRSGREVIQ